METQINDEPIQATMEDFEIDLMTDEEIEEANRMLESPIFPDNTKTIVVDFNIRSNNLNSFSKAKEDSSEDHYLHYNLITQPEVCLMQYDLQKTDEETGSEIVFDRMIVRSAKPLEYWKNIFK